MIYVPMSERCIHIICPEKLICTKCRSPWDLAKNDPRPFDVVRAEKKGYKEPEKYDMNEEIPV